QIQDYSGQIWATAFNEAAIELIGYTADEMETLQESNEAEFNRIMAEATFKSYIFKLRVSDETGSDGNVRKRTTVQKAT
ncbi:hypothetical protein JEG46_08440, partial [Anoxybacillus sp. LAT_26]|uniref:hypothetical protein n=1 Tax=Anoxybacillus sp. LAT_26 TaxID=2862719 RepID=UPI001EEBE7F8